jgi:methanogenic corrinoid protein MtbC1
MTHPRNTGHGPAPPDSHVLSQRLRRFEHAIAEAAADAFLAAHPDQVETGDGARVSGIEEARFHVQFLAAAVESGSPESFRDYVQWTARVQGARGIAPAALWENLRHVEAAAGVHLAEPGRRRVAAFLDFAARAGVPPPAGEANGPLALTRRMFVQAILAGERKAALAVALETLRGGTPVQDLYADVFQAAMYDVGARWEANNISVAQEHMATAVTQFVMAQVFEHIDPPAASRGRAIVTGVPGELHQVGALMVSDMLEACGWQVQFLGSNLPIPSILEAVAGAKPELLGISVTMLFNLQHARDLVGQARAAASGLRVVVGGAAFNAPDAWRATGADDYAADVRSAVALLCGQQA